MNYRREIDGLRALAVISVILYHAGFKVFSGGFVGVDVFFVISGYLITAIILSELEQGKFSIVNFYERRARRILPALFLVMLVCISFAWIWLLPSDMKDFSQSLIAVSVFASNVLFWHESGYFDTASELKPLLHTWSLAVEEQYYVLFPIFLMLAWRFGKRWIIAILAVVAVTSLSVAQWSSIAKPEAAFYLLPTRGWELLIGAFCAFYLAKVNRNDFGKGWGEAGACLGLALTLYSVFAFSKATPFPSLYALAPTLGTLLIILFASQKTLIGRLMGNKVFVGIGLISYSAYLWHQPLFAFARHRSLTELNEISLALLSLASLILAFFSWKFVELPFRVKGNMSRNKIFIFAFLGSALFISLGLAGHLKNGFPSRLPRIPQFAEFDLPRIDNGWCFYSIDTIPSLTYGDNGLNCLLGDLSSSTEGVLFGDSYAGHYEPLWDVVGHRGKFKIKAITTNWCYPSLTNEFTGPLGSRAFEQCLFNRKYLHENILDYDFVVLAGSWGSVLSQSKLSSVLEMIKYTSKKVRVVVIMAAPKSFDTNPLNEYRRSVWRNYDFEIKKIGTSKDRTTSEANNILKEYAKNFDNVIFVDRDSLFVLNDSPTDVTNDGIPFSLDGGHISIYGSKVADTNFLASDTFEKVKSLLR